MKFTRKQAKEIEKVFNYRSYDNQIKVMKFLDLMKVEFELNSHETCITILSIEDDAE